MIWCLLPYWQLTYLEQGNLTIIKLVQHLKVTCIFSLYYCYTYLHTEYYNTLVSVEIDYDTKFNITITCQFHDHPMLNTTSIQVCSVKYKSQFDKGATYSGTVILNIYPIQGGRQNFTIIATNDNHTIHVEGKFNISGTACTTVIIYFLQYKCY